MTNTQIILLIWPVYFILGYFVFLYRNRHKGDLLMQSELESLTNKIASLVDQLAEVQSKMDKMERYIPEHKVNHIEENIKTHNQEIKEVKEEVNKTEEKTMMSLTEFAQKLKEENDAKIRKEFEALMVEQQVEKHNLEMEILEENRYRNVDAKQVDEDLSRIGEQLVDTYFKNNYLGRKDAYDISTGIFKMPEISDRTKNLDLAEIFETFLKVINKNMLAAKAAYIYDMEEPETKALLLEKYIVPFYSERMQKMLDEWDTLQRKIAEDAEVKAAEELHRKEMERIRKESEKPKDPFEAQLEDDIKVAFRKKYGRDRLPTDTWQSLDELDRQMELARQMQIKLKGGIYNAD